MVSSVSPGLPFNIEQLVANAINQGVLNRRDYLKLAAAMLATSSLTATERNHINQVFDFIRSGQVHLAD
jgi:Ni,Fe-hydrogenase I small subunit